MDSLSSDAQQTYRKGQGPLPVGEELLLDHKILKVRIRATTHKWE